MDKPKHDKQAEQGVLGAILRNNKALGDVVKIVSAEDFYSYAHQRIFQAMLAMYGQGNTPIDPVLLSDWLESKGLLENCGGDVYMVDLWEAAASGPTYYAEIVKEKAIGRSVQRVCAEVSGDVSAGMPGGEALDKAEAAIFEIAQRRVLVNQTFTVAQIMNEAADRLEARNEEQRGGQRTTGVPSGFSDLDFLTNGFQDSELAIIAARPSVGKTSLGLNIFYNAFVKYNVPCLFFSLEQGRVEIAERFYALHAEIDSHKMRRAQLADYEWQRLAQARSELQEAIGFINDCPGMNMLHIFSEARHWKVKANIRMVIVDYLQLITPEDRRENRVEQVGHISRRLKLMARELKIPVLAMAQLNRTAEDRKPRLSDLRESGAIEQDSDMVILLHDPNRHEQREGENAIQGQIDVQVAKQRNGRTGEMKLFFQRQFMKFSDMVR